MFKFGLQLIPPPPALPIRSADDDEVHDVEYEREDAPKRLDCLTLGLPLDQCTNTASRQHLRFLRPKRLEISLLLHPNASLLTELATLFRDTDTHLSIRYLASDRAPQLPDPSILLDPSLNVFPTIDLHIPSLTGPGRPPMLPHRPFTNQPSPHTSFADHLVSLISLDPSMRRRYAVYLEHAAPPMGGFGPGWMKPEERVVWEREVDAAWPGSAVGPDSGEGVVDAGSSRGEKRDVGKAVEERGDAGGAGEDHWERETNLKLLGGLISLRLESKKH